MRQKHCWNHFAFNQSYLAEGKIAPVILLPHQAKQKHMILHWRITTGSYWCFQNLRIGTWSDSISSDQDWTRTEKFYSLLISAKYQWWSLSALPSRYPRGYWVCNQIPISKKCFQTGTRYGSIRKYFLDISRIQTLGKSCIMHNHSFSIFGNIFCTFCAMTPSLSMV